VKSAGDVPSAKAFYERVDVLAVPSLDSEGFRTTILEAMAMGLRSWPQTSAEPMRRSWTVSQAPGRPRLAKKLCRMLSRAMRMIATCCAQWVLQGERESSRRSRRTTLIDAHISAFSDLVQCHW
jgi:hypothetical protein